MQLEFLRQFSKDIDRINHKSVKKVLIDLIKLAETADSLKSISN